MIQTPPTKRLGLHLTDAEFHMLNGYARSHQLPVKDFVAKLVRAYLDAMGNAQ